MAAGTYPLQAVLDLRRRQRDTAREALADRIEEERRTRQELTRLERRAEVLAGELAQTSERLYEPAADGTLEVAGTLDRRADLDHCRERVEAHGEKIERQQRAIDTAKAAIAAARHELLEATRALEAIEKHFSRWLEQAARKARRAEERFAEEITTSRFVSGQST